MVRYFETLNTENTDTDKDKDYFEPDSQDEMSTDSKVDDTIPVPGFITRNLNPANNKQRPFRPSFCKEDSKPSWPWNINRVFSNSLC